MNYEWDDRIELHVDGRISLADAQRQRRTAGAILERFKEQPGVILADEVGMGKTFVALGVGASVALTDPEQRPVVVMVPSSLKEKWPSDFAVFRDCCLPPALRGAIRCATAERAVEFLKLLDDPPERRAQFIFLTHGAMSRSLADKWVMLALIYQALKGRWGVEQIRKNVSRHTGGLLQMPWVDKQAPDVWEALLRTPPEKWLRILHRHGIDPENDNDPNTDDDPVPQAVCEALSRLNTDDIYQALLALPKRKSTHYKSRLKILRRALKKEMRSLWDTTLQRLHIHLPLLILDEAHHLKNAQTRLASLFQSEEARGDAEEITKGPLAGAFERMLFLTATPFQLGHNELCSVLERFNAVDWCSQIAPNMGAEQYRNTVQNLREALDGAQEAAVVLDLAWGRLGEGDLVIDGEPCETAEFWWEAVGNKKTLSPNATHVLECYERTRDKMQAAGELLRPWVIRHLKPKFLPDPSATILRRRRLVGAEIANDRISNGGIGLTVSGESLLPFLLAARATATSPESRPVFAEGLASSYEAFLHTRSLDVDQIADTREPVLDDDETETDHSVPEAAEWYLGNLTRLIPSGDLDSSRTHPKIAATVARVLDLWRAGEKVLLFCHYVATGRILRQHLSDAISNEIVKLGAKNLGCPSDVVAEELNRISKRFFDTDSPIRRACDEEVDSLLRNFSTLDDYRGILIDVVRRNVRTPTFLVRYFPLSRDNLDADAMAFAMRQPDESGFSLQDLLRRFFHFLAARCNAVERERYINAIQRIQTGNHLGGDVASTFSPDELQSQKVEQLLPNVRLVNGRTRQDTRQRLMLTFNTPFYPEILIASSVMAEGVDLHLNCRNVIHHDLCWNPSMLEQRTGRVDRIGAKAEQCGQPIHVYLPYIAETQDEKMFRVVTDRERWFNVVMGEEYQLDARTTDQLAERIPLPSGVAESLAFDLAVDK